MRLEITSTLAVTERGYSSLPLYVFGLITAECDSVWRPLSRPIEDSPLAFCDPRTLSEEDLVAADRVAPEYAGEIYYVMSNPKQRWYWLSHQKPEEVAVFLSFDSLCSSAKTPINCKSLLHAVGATIDRFRSLCARSLYQSNSLAQFSPT